MSKLYGREVKIRPHITRLYYSKKRVRASMNITPHVKFPLTLEHANVDGEGPITFRTKKDLIRHCNSKGLSSGALL